MVTVVTSSAPQKLTAVLGLPKTVKIVEPSTNFFLKQSPSSFYLDNYISPTNTYALLTISGILIVAGLLIIKFSKR